MMQQEIAPTTYVDKEIACFLEGKRNTTEK